MRTEKFAHRKLTLPVEAQVNVLMLDFLVLPIVSSDTGGQCHALLWIAYHLIGFVLTYTEPSLLLLQLCLQCDWHHVVNN